MQIEFDPAKDAANIAKHGCSLADASAFEWDSAAVWPDTRFDYDEERMVGIGYIGNRLFAVAFVDRGARRIISLRKANKREEKIYAKA